MIILADIFHQKAKSSVSKHALALWYYSLQRRNQTLTHGLGPIRVSVKRNAWCFLSGTNWVPFLQRWRPRLQAQEPSGPFEASHSRAVSRKVGDRSDRVDPPRRAGFRWAWINYSPKTLLMLSLRCRNNFRKLFVLERSWNWFLISAKIDSLKEPRVKSN